MSPRSASLPRSSRRLRSSTPHDDDREVVGARPCADRPPPTALVVARDAFPVSDRRVDVGLDVRDELVETDRAFECRLEVLLPARGERLLADVRIEREREFALLELSLQDLLDLLLEGSLLGHERIERLQARDAPAALRAVLRRLTAHVLLEDGPRGVGVLRLRGDDPSRRGHRRIAPDAGPRRRRQEYDVAR